MQCRASWMFKKFGSRYMFSKVFRKGGKPWQTISHSKIFPAKLCMYFHGPEFLGHLVVAVSRSSGAKFFFGWKSSRGNVEYMTRIIFLGGILNRQQDIIKLCRRPPCSSEHANIAQKHILCDEIFRLEKFARKCRIYDQNYFSRWQS